MSTVTAPRFNKQKENFLNEINKLENVGKQLISELTTKGKLNDLEPKIITFTNDIRQLVNDLGVRKEIFADLAFNISSGLGSDYKDATKEKWLEGANNQHSEGIFHWMHNTILDLLTVRWKKLNLGSSGPSEPPIYQNVKFENYKQIINTQNRTSKNINNKRRSLLEQLNPLMEELSNISNKVKPKANRASSSQSPDNK